MTSAGCDLCQKSHMFCGDQALQGQWRGDLRRSLIFFTTLPLKKKPQGNNLHSRAGLPDRTFHNFEAPDPEIGKIPRRTLSQFWSFAIRRSANFLQFRIVVRRILKLQNCERVRRVVWFRKVDWWIFWHKSCHVFSMS